MALYRAQQMQKYVNMAADNANPLSARMAYASQFTARTTS